MSARRRGSVLLFLLTGLLQLLEVPEPSFSARHNDVAPRVG
jgi:hypothetical protein